MTSSIRVMVKVPVTIYSQGENVESDALATHMASKIVELPGAIPTHLHLIHCPARSESRQQGRSAQLLTLSVEVASTSWREGNECITAFCKRQVWHDVSFQHAIDTMGECGWKFERIVI
jgi:hypothetical protein